MITCQLDRNLKTTLTPIVSKLSDMRVVNGELENMVFEPRKEFITMQLLSCGEHPAALFSEQGLVPRSDVHATGADHSHNLFCCNLHFGGFCYQADTAH